MAADVPDGRARVRVLIVDDHPLIRRMLDGLLKKEPGFEVVGAVEDAPEALTACGSLQPDVVIMDLSLPGMDGVAATALIRGRFPRVRVIVLTAHDDPKIHLAARRAGASDVVQKERATELLVAAIRAAR